jgi:hypothetical protein
MVGDVANASYECLNVLDEARVYAYNGVETDNFQVYHTSASVLPRPPTSCTPTTRPEIQGLLCAIAPLTPVLQRYVSPILASHITDLRQRINTVRTRLNLSAFAWSDAGLSAAGATPIRAQHILDLRSALLGIYVAMNLTPPSYTDPTIVVGTTQMKVEHITEIRSALLIVE